MRRYVEIVVRVPWIVIALTVLMTAALAVQVRHLHVVIDPNSNLPQQHPYVTTTAQIEKVFGARHVLIIGITPREGDAFSPHVLAKVQRITAALQETPGVVRGSLLSLAARRVKNIKGTPDGMDVRPLMETVPRSEKDVEALRAAVGANPVYVNSVVSRDRRTAAIVAEFDEDASGFQGMVAKVRPLVERERDPSVEIAVGGFPVYLAEIERYSQRMAFLFPLAVVLIGLIHYEAFRTLQGMILPLVTALLAVVWGLGVMGVAGVPMDAFNATTPILILAVAAGHAVQILKRYYEEYHRLQAGSRLPPREANRLAVIESLTRIGPVMLTAGSVATLGFLSLLVFDIRTIRTFGVFTGLGILSALILEMTFIPALRSLLPAPSEREGRRERELTRWDRIVRVIAGWVTGRRRLVFAVAAGLLVFCAVGAARVVVDNSTRTLFFSNLPFQLDDRALNRRLGGTNTLFLLVEGREPDAIKDPRTLQGMDATERFLEQQPYIGKAVSLADFIKRMNRAMNGDDPAADRIPASRELIAQYLLLYSMSGEPGDFDSYVDYEYRSANMWVFIKTDSSAYVEELIGKLNAFIPGRFPDAVRVRIGGTVPQTSALNDVMVHGKILNIVQFGSVILLITSLVFRSLLAGFLVLVPLTLAVVVNFGLMGWTGIRLDIGTALISAMAVGIGADYAIYLIYRLREELARGGEEAMAFTAALGTAGKAILFVASAVAGGYGVLIFSYGFYVHMWFAILIATAMLTSALGALTLLPGLILAFRPRFVFGAARRRATARPATLAAILLLWALGLTPGNAPAAEPTATEIMEKNFGVTKVLDSVSHATLTLINKNGQERVRTIFTTTKLQPNGIDNMRMTRFLSPPDVKGTVTLLIEHSDRDDDIWIYLPALKKVRRLVASNKKDSFVGTDFSYGDVIGHKVGEWTHRLVGEETVDGQPCYVIESLPKTEDVKATSGYSKRRLWIRKDNAVMIKAEYWDQAGQPLKTFTAADVRLVDPARAKWQPMRLETRNVQTGHRTVIQFEDFKANQQIKDDYFTTRYMEREP